MTSLPFPALGDHVDKPTQGVAIPVLGESELCGTAQLVGTVNSRHSRWNPFLPENNMVGKGGVFWKDVELRPRGGRHGDGVYAFRFVTNHNLRQTYKARHDEVDHGGKPRLVGGEQSHGAQNVIIQVDRPGLYRFRFNPAENTFDVSPSVKYLTSVESVQLNGFVWDDENDFQKFDETRASHEMTRVGDWWEKTVFLKTTGGISFRHDGVYQFLFSVNHNEDWGFAGFNNGGQRLTGGTGFGSSGGQSRHSAITIRVVQDGEYTIRIYPGECLFDVREAAGSKPVKYLNAITSLQLLGTFAAGFDPTKEETMMQPTGDNQWAKTIELEPGIYGANFAISRELFLDTMALGAWLDSSSETRLVGRAWHGKPNEPNVFFEVKKKGQIHFAYDAGSDEFSIESLDGGALEPKVTIDTLQVVGDPPFGNWDPANTGNNMQRTGESLFTKTVRLEAGKTYKYKYTANNWPWTWSFADYELDGYGSDYAGRNSDPENSRLEDLRRFGHLTTHGNPEPLQVIADVTADYKFTVNLETGAYSVHPKRSSP